MVVLQEPQDRTDRLFHALSDPTRRDILRTVLVREQSVSVLARRYPMSFAAVQKHIAVMERAELVHKRRQGREQLVGGDIEVVLTANRLLDEYAEIWRSRVDRMADLLAEPPEEPSPPVEPRPPLTPNPPIEVAGPHAAPPHPQKE